MKIGPRSTSVALACTLILGCSSKSNQGRERADKPKASGMATVQAVLSLGIKGQIGVEARRGEGAWRRLAVGHGLDAGESLRTTKGTRGRLALKDGSLLLLNQKTELRLIGERELSVAAGELLARVKRVSGKPLAIETPAGKVRVTGTKLNLQVGKDKTTTVDVTRGSVEVEGAGARVQVGAGERAVLRPGKRPRVSLSQDLVRVVSWSREVAEPRRSVEQLQQGFGSLTARVPGQGGGRPLRLAEQQVRVTVRDNVARTEVEQVYENPSSQTLEGTYRFPLPSGASIARLALYVGKTLMEGEVVERHRARRIFNQIVNDTIQPRDPALLEWMGGRTFRMKIFPIPPRGSRRVILAYVQPLTASYGRYSYVYPMSTSKGKATRVGRFSIDMNVSGARGVADVGAPLYPVLKERQGDGVRLRYEATDFTPAASFVANFRPEGAVPEVQLALYEKKGARGPDPCARYRGIQAMSSGGLAAVPVTCADRGGFFMAVVRPELPTEGRANRRDYLFVMDSSHSVGPGGWGLQVQALEAFLSEMDMGSRVNVMACDERCRALGKSFIEPTSEGRRKALAFVRGLTVGGSSNLQATFAEAGKLASSAGRPVHVVYMGDGRPTAGELREPQLARLVVESLREHGATLSVLQMGDDVAELFLKEATRRLAGSIYTIEAGDDMRTRVFEIVAAQYRPTLTNLEASFEGVQVHHVYPGRLPSLVAGSEVIVTGRYERPGSGALRLTGTVDGKPFERRYPITLAANLEERSANSFIPRLWAREHLDALSVADYAGNRGEIVRVSQEYSVLSRATAFLVLENERMYREFNVKRRRNRDYWKGKGVATRTLRDKSDSPADEKAKDEAAPAGEAKQAEREEAGRSGGGKALSARLGSTAGPSASEARKARPKPSARPKPPPPMAKAAPTRQPRADLADPFSDDDADAPEKSAEPSTPAPAAEPPPPRPRTKAKRRPARRARRSRPMRKMPRKMPRRTLDPLSGVDLGGRGYYRHRHPVRVPVTKIEPIVDVSVTPTARRAEERLERQVKARPLSRTHRSRYHRALVQNGNYSRALDHARKWVELDGSRVRPVLALADMQAAMGLPGLAKRTYSTSVEIQPWNVRLHRSLSRMYRNKGELRRSCAHVWSVMSLHPKRLENHLALAACLAELPDGKARAMQLLTELVRSPAGKRGGNAARIGRALARLAEGKASERRNDRGALVLKATWDRGVDLDLGLITPDGRRISALRAGRRGGVTVDSHDGASAEVLALGWLRNGTYRVEIGPASDRGLDAPVTGTLLIKARGKTRAVPFVVQSRVKPVAQLSLTSRWAHR
jgi:tetratricopeptide (TPR) repeat protein